MNGLVVNYLIMRLPAGTRRNILGEEMEISRTLRIGLFIETSWRLVNIPCDITSASKYIRKFKYNLGNI